MAQWVKDLVLSLPWHRFGLWSRNFHMLQARQKKIPSPPKTPQRVDYLMEFLEVCT